MELEVLLRGGFGDPPEHGGKRTGLRGGTEEGAGVVLARAVAVELEEDVLADTWRKRKPRVDPGAGGWVVVGELAGLDARHPASAETQARWAGDHEQIAPDSTAGAGFNAGVEAPRPGGIASGPVNLIEDARLRGGGNRGHGEVGVAAQVAEELELAGDTAPAAVGAGVVERPVAVDEAEDDAAVLATEKAVPLVQAVAEVGDLLLEAGGGVVIVVDVDFDVGGAGSAERGEGVEDLGPVLFLGVEAGEAGALSGGIARGVLGDARPEVPPGLDAAEGGSQRIAGERLVMIGDGDPDAPGGRGSGEAASTVAEIAGQPEICVFGEVHDRPDAERLGALP